MRGVEQASKKFRGVMVLKSNWDKTIHERTRKGVRAISSDSWIGLLGAESEAG
jgi:hypothetical protein